MRNCSTAEGFRLTTARPSMSLDPITLADSAWPTCKTFASLLTFSSAMSEMWANPPPKEGRLSSTPNWSSTLLTTAFCIINRSFRPLLSLLLFEQVSRLAVKVFIFNFSMGRSWRGTRLDSRHSSLSLMWENQSLTSKALLSTTGLLWGLGNIGLNFTLTRLPTSGRFVGGALFCRWGSSDKAIFLVVGSTNSIRALSLWPSVNGFCQALTSPSCNEYFVAFKVMTHRGVCKGKYGNSSVHLYLANPFKLDVNDSGWQQWQIKCLLDAQNLELSLMLRLWSLS